MNNRFLLTKAILITIMLFLSATGFSQVKLDYKATPKTLAKGQSFKGLTPESARFLTLLRQSETAEKTTERSAATKRLHDNYGVTKGCVSATLVLANNRSQNELMAYDVAVGRSYGGVLTAMIPLNRFAELSASGICESIDVGHKMTPLMDRVRNNLGIDRIYQGLDLPQGYDGTGVVIGIIDQSFEFCHPSFYDTTGTQLRVKRVWNQGDDTGTSPYGFNYGSEYTTEAQMMAVFTDDSIAFHGTHVAGIAAGCGAPSGRGMAYRGIAPGADIVFVPTLFTQASILDAINYIHEYAQSVNKPCVINMSFGTLSGPHDGTASWERFMSSFMEQNTDSIALVASAGNGGNGKEHIGKQFSASDTLVTRVNYLQGINMDGTVNLWAEQNFSFALSLVNVNTFEQEDFTGFFSNSTDTIFTTTLVATNGYTINCEFFLNEISSYNNLYNAGVYIYSDTVPEKREVILSVTSDTDDNLLHIWGDKLSYELSYVLEEAVEGDGQYTIAGFGANTDAVISVGAYNTRLNVNSYNGHIINETDEVTGNIWSSSSIGPTRDGRVKPDITAPGQYIVAPSSRYAYNPMMGAIYDTIQWNGYTEKYAAISGTSMSAPIVTGIIALWMQHNPSLGIEELRNIIHNTARNDRFTGHVVDQPSNIWGHGKVNAYGGLPATDTALFLVNAYGIDEAKGTVTGGGVVTEGIHTLTAIPNAMFTFEQWEDGNTDNPRVVDISCDTTFFAYFQPLPYEDCDTITEFPWEPEFDAYLTCWKTIDADGNGTTWKKISSNVTCMESQTHIDNWLISPAIKVNGQLVLKVNMQAITMPVSIYSHDFSIMISTSGSEMEDFTTLIRKTYKGSTSDVIEVSLSDFEGQVVRLALRQHNNNYLMSVMTLNSLTIEPSPPVFEKEIAAYTQKGGYYLISSPIGTVNPEDVANMLENSFDLYYFDQAASDGKEWINYKTQTYNLESGKGYLYANSGNVLLTFTGEPYEGNGEVTLIKADGVEFEGWNLVGNPFGTSATSSKPFYRLNEEGSELSANTETSSIDAMEGIFVIADEDGEIMTFSTEPEASGSDKLVLNLSQGRGIIDRAIVRFGTDAELPKFQLNPNNTKLYIPRGIKDFAIVNTEAQGELPVNFKAKENGTYTISVNTEGLELDYLHLIDNMTGADVDLLATSSYTFTAKTTDYESRFKLVFAVKDGPSTGSGTFAFISDGNIIVNGEGVLQVVDVMGRIIISTNFARNVSTSGMTPGVYVLRLIDENDVRTQKIVIK